MKSLLVLILYFALAHFSRLFNLPHGLSSLFFPAAGMAIAAVLVYGPKVLFSVFLGCALFVFSQSYDHFIYNDFSSYLFIVTALVVTVQAYVGYLLTRKFLNEEKILTKTNDVIKFVLLPSLLTPLISCFFAFTAYGNEGHFNLQSMAQIGAVWYLGDAIGTAFGLTTFLAIFRKFDTKFNSRKYHILTYSLMTLIFILFYFLTTIEQEAQKEKGKLKLLSSELFFRIENRFDSLSTRLLGLRDLIYSSQKVEEDEFNTYLSSIFKKHKGIEYVLWTSSEENLPISYSAPKDIFQGSHLKKLGILEYIYPAIQNGDFDFFVTTEDAAESFYLTLPVFKIVPGKRVRSLEGILVVKAKTAIFIKEAYKDVSSEGHRLQINFYQEKSKKTLYDSLISYPIKDFETSEYLYNKKIRVFNKTLEFSFVLDQNTLLDEIDFSFIIIGLVGLFFSVLTSIVGLVHSGRNIVIYAKVENKTAELTWANEKLKNNQFLQSEFLINMGHEIKTKVNSLLGLIDLLKNGKEQSLHSRYYEMMQDCAKEIFDTVNDIVDISNLETAKVKTHKTPFSVDRFLQKIEIVYAPKIHKKGLDFEIVKEGEMPDFLVSDRARLKQVLGILLDKSIENTRQGKIQLICSTSYKNNSNYFKAHIVDTGEEIPHAETATLFVPFDELSQQEIKKFRGTGLGFSLCYRIIQALGGQISYKRQNEEGRSHYLFEIPVDVYFDESGYGKMIKESEKKPLDLVNKKILLVEDNEISQLICNRFFEKLGAGHDLAENGQIALEKIEKNHYDIIFMDLMMPVMDGIIATSKIQEMKLTDRPLIIGMSTLDQLEGERQCLEAGMDDYLSKPFQFSDMVKILSKYFSK